MAGSSFGNYFRIHTFGESHGAALGAIVDGCPAGLAISEEDIQKYLDRRKPGQSSITTQRSEADKANILSGVFEGVTTGTPIAITINNTSQRSKDYSDLANVYRPGHADMTFDAKYGIRDYRGGGRSSGRETAARVAGGAIAAKMLGEMGISLCAYTKSIGPVAIDPERFDPSLITKTPTSMPDALANTQAEEYIHKCMEEKDSVGGVIECIIKGLPKGLGEPVFDKLDALLSQAVMSVGAVKAVEIGDGCAVAGSKGSLNNDPFTKDGKLTNHSGGTLGGMSDGSDLILRAYIKPTPSIFREQQTINRDGEEVSLTI
ncbi:MAG: chorismate synthase, partial [Lachnospiraceae bacterium]|nr:chorismate synthase [Lachnospiraceae bacterium]